MSATSANGARDGAEAGGKGAAVASSSAIIESPVPASQSEAAEALLQLEPKRSPTPAEEAALAFLSKPGGGSEGVKKSRQRQRPAVKVGAEV